MSVFDAKRFYEEQIEYLAAGKTDELIDAHYHADAVLLSVETVIQGNDALKKHFREYVRMLGNLVVKSTDHFVETGGAILLEARVLTRLGDFAVYDAFVLRDGRITHHFTGVK